MSIRAHRVIKVEYGGEFVRSSSKLLYWLENNGDFNDQRNMDAGGMIEFLLVDLKNALKANQEGSLELEEFDLNQLKKEIETLEKEGFTDDDWIQYDCF